MNAARYCDVLLCERRKIEYMIGEQDLRSAAIRILCILGLKKEDDYCGPVPLHLLLGVADSEIRAMIVLALKMSLDMGSQPKEYEDALVNLERCVMFAMSKILEPYCVVQGEIGLSLFSLPNKNLGVADYDIPLNIH